MGEERGRRAELLARAAHLFRVKGYHATTMKDIAAELEILPGSLYHHIESKESLLLEIMELGITTLLERIQPLLESELPPDRKLEQIIRTHAETIAESTDVLAVFLHEVKSLPEARREAHMAMRDRYERLVRDLVRQGIEQGRFRALDPRLTTFAILGMVNWMYAWYRPDGPMRPDEIAEEYISLLWHGLGARESLAKRVV